MDIRRLRLKGLMYGTAAGLALAVAAAGPAAADQIENLQGQIDTLQSELERIKAQQGEMQQVQAAAAKKADKTVKLLYKPALRIASEDGFFKFRIGGRIMVDSAWYDEDKSDMGDGTELRRARIFFSGTVFNVWDYKWQIDFAGGDHSIKDMYIKYKGFKPVALKVGNFMEWWGLEQLSSSKYVTFTERSMATNAFSAYRRIGAMASTNGANWTAAAALFGSGVTGDAANEGDERWHLNGRVTFAPLYEKTRVLHLGVGATFGDPNDETLRYRVRPETHVFGNRFVDTGNIPRVDNDWRIAAHLAVVYGPFSVQGEYMHVGVERDSADDLDFNGWYAEASYFLTGESRNYLPKKGIFGVVKPKQSVTNGGYGAWQIAVRYSGIDLSDEDIRGGQARNVTLGLNWHATTYVRFMLNAVWVNNDNEALGNAGNLHDDEVFAGDDDPFIVQLRAQVHF